MKYSITTLLWLIAVFASFMFGITIRDANDPLTSILVADRQLDAEMAVSSTDFRIELQRRSTLPKGAFTEKSQIGRNIETTRPLSEGQPIVAEYFRSYIGLTSDYVPKNRYLYAINLKNPKHSLANHLLSEGDIISLHAQFLDKTGTGSRRILANCATVFVMSPDKPIIGLLVTTSEKQDIKSAFKDERFVDFHLDEPVNG